MGMQPGPQNPVMMGNNPANQMNMPSSNQQMSNLIPGQPNQQPMMSGQPNPNNPGMPQPGIGMGGQVPGSQPPHGGQVPCFFFTFWRYYNIQQTTQVSPFQEHTPKLRGIFDEVV